MKTKNLRKENAITLVALIITIIVLLILATVSIALVINSGIISKADESVNRYSDEEVQEMIKTGYSEYQMVKYHGQALSLRQAINNSGLTITDEDITGEGPWTITVGEKSYTLAVDGSVTTSSSGSGSGAGKSVTHISKTASENFVGYYADVDGNGTVDGVIFADLLVGNTKGTQWANAEGTYTIPTKSADSLKEYYISQESHTWAGTTKPVLSPDGAGDDRFYVMAFNNIGGSSTTYTWYNNEEINMSDYATATSGDFGTGRINTATMLTKWNASSYGTKDTDNDLWGQIDVGIGGTNEGWFVPSRAEWSAFVQELGIDLSNYGNIGLDDAYWSSSQCNTTDAWNAKFSYGVMFNSTVYHYAICVRLATTF